MKISFLVRWLPPRIDGVGDYTWNLARALREYGINVYVFTSEKHGCKGLVKNEWVFPIIKQWQPQAVVKALKTVTGNTSDWLCFQYVPQMYGRWGICWQVADILRALKNEFRCKIAVTFHEFISKWGIGLKDVFLASVLHLQTKRILAVADLAITTCSRYKDSLQRIAPHLLPIVVIPVGSNIEPVFITQEDVAAARRQIFPMRAKVFGLFNRHYSSRNFSLVLRVLKQAKKEGLDARLHLIGNIESSNPRLFQKLMVLAEEIGVKSHIVSTGELSKENLSVRLRMVDVFFFPHIDGISTRSTTLMAALAHGLPVLSFKPQLGNFDGFNIPCCALMDRNDEQGFIRTAVECLKESENLSRIASANSDYYYRHFSWPVIAKEYIKALKV